MKKYVWKSQATLTKNELMEKFTLSYLMSKHYETIPNVDETKLNTLYQGSLI